MILHPAARAAAVVCALLAGPACAAGRLSLEEAFARTLRSQPELEVFAHRADALDAERGIAARRPAWALGAEFENVLGTGDAADASEITIGLGATLERGGKREARVALAERRREALDAEREARRLDLLAETARRHVALAAAEERERLARRDVDERSRAVESARERLRAGASPRAVVLAAEAARAQAALALARATAGVDTARRHLASLWSDTTPGISTDRGWLHDLPDLPPLAQLTSMLDAAPEQRRFNDERRIRDAELRLARSEAAADIGVQVGPRWLNENGDIGLVASVSLPLGSRTRAAPAIRAAQAGLAELDARLRADVRSRHAALVAAHGRYLALREEVERLDREILPAFEAMVKATTHAWRAGAASPLEWRQAQAEAMAARRQRVDAAAAALDALIDIRRLTGRTLVDDVDATVATGRIAGGAR